MNDFNLSAGRELIVVGVSEIERLSDIGAVRFDDQSCLVNISWFYSIDAVAFYGQLTMRDAVKTSSSDKQERQNLTLFHDVIPPFGQLLSDAI